MPSIHRPDRPIRPILTHHNVEYNHCATRLPTYPIILNANHVPTNREVNIILDMLKTKTSPQPTRIVLHGSSSRSGAKDGQCIGRLEIVLTLPFLFQFSSERGFVNIIKLSRHHTWLPSILNFELLVV